MNDNLFVKKLAQHRFEGLNVFVDKPQAAIDLLW